MFSEESKFKPVPHIPSGAKAYGTEGNESENPGAQFQTLINRDKAIAETLELQVDGEGNVTGSKLEGLPTAETLQPLEKKIEELSARLQTLEEKSKVLEGLDKLRDTEGILSANQLLGTDVDGRMTVIPKPRQSFTRVALATLLSKLPEGSQGGAGTGDWDLRTFNFPISTKPQGINSDWITTPGGNLSFRLNSPGQYLVHIVAVANKVDAHQLRLRNVKEGTTFPGTSIQTTNPNNVHPTLKTNFEKVEDDLVWVVRVLGQRRNISYIKNIDTFSGVSAVTVSEVSACFTLATSPTEPQLPQDFAVEHRLKAFSDTRSFGAETKLGEEVYLLASITHIGIQTLDFGDPTAVIQTYG